MMKNLDVHFVQRGDVVEMVQNVPKNELNPGQVLNMCLNYEKSIEDLNNKLFQLGNQKVELEEKLEESKFVLDKISKFKEWASMWQESKLKAIAEEVKEECKKKVIDTYKKDAGITEEQNKVQMYHQFRHFVATHEKMQKSVHMSVARKMLFDENYLPNPF